MRKIIFFFLLFSCSHLKAQSICGPFQLSSQFAFITIPDNANMLAMGQPIPFGSTIIAVDEDYNCVSLPVTWEQQEVSFFINGEANGIEGYKINEQIKLLVSVSDSCFLEVSNLLFMGHGTVTSSFFQPNNQYRVGSFQAFSNFSIADIDTEGTLCGEPTASVELEVFGGLSPYDYNWSHDANPLLENVLMDLDTGSYIVTVTDILDCSIIETIEITADAEAIQFQFAVDTMQVVCDELVLENALPCAGCSYSWSTGANSNSITVTDDGTYYVTISTNDCEERDSIEVSFSEPLEITAMVSDDFVCEGDTVVLSATGALTYDWGYVGSSVFDPTAATTEAIINEYTVFRVVGRDLCFADTAYLWVDLWPKPSAGKTQCIAKDNFDVQLNASGAVEYLWEENAIGPVSDPTISNPTASPTETTRYFVNFVDENGCATRGSVLVEVIDDIISSIPLYNIITPNGDGKNDFLVFDKLETAVEKELIVFDRWGKKVFESEAYANDWGGTRSGGKALPGGSYYYILTVNGTPLRSKLTIVYE